MSRVRRNWTPPQVAYLRVAFPAGLPMPEMIARVGELGPPRSEWAIRYKASDLRMHGPTGRKRMRGSRPKAAAGEKFKSPSRPGLGPEAAAKQPRVCLKCRRKFPSAGIGNRVCGACKKIVSSISSLAP